MNSTSDINPPIIPQASTPPVYGPVDSQNEPVKPTFNPGQFATNPMRSKRRIVMAVLVVTVILIVLITIKLMSGNRDTPTTSAPTPLPTATQSAAANRILSPIASQSAFIKFEADLDDLTRGMKNTQIQNQQLLPPRMDLPLGF